MAKSRTRRGSTRNAGPGRYRNLGGETELSRDMIIGLDGSPVGPWPIEYDRAFTLRLLNSDSRRPQERVAFAVLREKYPALLVERSKRIELIKAARAARKH